MAKVFKPGIKVNVMEAAVSVKQALGDAKAAVNGGAGGVPQYDSLILGDGNRGVFPAHRHQNLYESGRPGTGRKICITALRRHRSDA